MWYCHVILSLKFCPVLKSVLKILFSLKISTNAVLTSEKLCQVYSEQMGLSGDIERMSERKNVPLIER